MVELCGLIFCMILDDINWFEFIVDYFLKMILNQQLFVVEGR